MGEPFDDIKGPTKGLWGWVYDASSFDRKRPVRNDILWEELRALRAPSIALSLAWRDAAVADGWACEPTYGDHESVDRAYRLNHPEGFTAQGLARTGSERSLPVAELHIWGPDGLRIEPPATYDMAAIRAGLRRCDNCKATDVSTRRYSFAGRCCDACRPEMARQHEQPGWTK